VDYKCGLFACVRAANTALLAARESVETLWHGAPPTGTGFEHRMIMVYVIFHAEIAQRVRTRTLASQE